MMLSKKLVLYDNGFLSDCDKLENDKIYIDKDGNYILEKTRILSDQDIYIKYVDIKKDELNDKEIQCIIIHDEIYSNEFLEEVRYMMKDKFRYLICNKCKKKYYISSLQYLDENMGKDICPICKTKRKDENVLIYNFYNDAEEIKIIGKVTENG